MNNNTLHLYRRLRRDPVSMLVGFAASHALSAARTIDRFETLASEDLVRITSEDEQENYFDVYGREDSEKYQKAMEETLRKWGCVCVRSEFRDESGEWQMADSIGMCVYANPESPFENCYVTDLMEQAIKQAEAVQAEPTERAYWESRDVQTL